MEEEVWERKNVKRKSWREMGVDGEERDGEKSRKGR